MTESRKTTNHDEIRRWAEARDGRPARVQDTAILRIDFGEPEDNLEEIDWSEFFRIFDENKLEFLYQEKLESGETSRFAKFVDRG